MNLLTARFSWLDDEESIKRFKAWEEDFQKRERFALREVLCCWNGGGHGGNNPIAIPKS